MLLAHRDTLKEIHLCDVCITGSWQSLLAVVRDQLQVTKFRMTACWVNLEDEEDYNEGLLYLLKRLGLPPR